MTLTLQEVAQRTGRPYAVLKKHAQRGKLITHRDGARTVIEESDLEAYLLSEHLSEAVDRAEGQPLDTVTREVGNTIGRAPQFVIDSIIAGIPTQKKPGSSTAFKTAIESIPKRQIEDVSGPVDPDDPHCGFPIGWIHQFQPKWARVNSSRWSLGDAWYVWNGIFWEGGGVREGVILGEGQSPASPYSDCRPLSAPVAVPDKKAKRT